MATFRPTNKRTHQSGRKKTVCTSAVLDALGVDYTTFHYSACPQDMARILRREGFAVRSRRSTLGKAKTVGELRKHITKRGEGGNYLVFVKKHVLLLSGNGKTIVDTDARVRDRRKLESVYLVMPTPDKVEREAKAEEAVNKYYREQGYVPPGFVGNEKLGDLTEDQLKEVVAWHKSKKSK